MYPMRWRLNHADHGSSVIELSSGVAPQNVRIGNPNLSERPARCIRASGAPRSGDALRRFGRYDIPM
jgi:hypothetical protein